MAKVYKGDIGIVISVDMQEDISTGTNQKFYVKDPAGTTTTWTATIYGTDYLRHTIATGEIATAGEYLIQPYIEIGSWKGRGETVTLVVEELYA